MPHVLWELQGVQQAVRETGADGREHITGFQPAIQGALSAEEYDGAVRDLVNFLAYAAEPNRLQRERMGMWVILFLVIFTFVAYLLKKEYWRDIH